MFEPPCRLRISATCRYSRMTNRFISLCLNMKHRLPSLAAALRQIAPLQKRTLTAATVAILHVIFVCVLIFGLRLDAPAQQQSEMTVVLDTMTTASRPAAPAIPPLVNPDDPIIQTPQIAVDDPLPASTDTAPLAGGIGVTSPAEAIGALHSVPPLSAELLALARRALLRLRLSIAPDGSVSEAMVDSSSGSGDIDGIAVAWVKAHWRYKPAMRDGQPVTVTTTAIVPF
jgi:outer membrane biosynthesis protein TonB